MASQTAASLSLVVGVLKSTTAVLEPVRLSVAMVVLFMGESMIEGQGRLREKASCSKQARALAQAFSFMAILGEAHEAEQHDQWTQWLQKHNRRDSTTSERQEPIEALVGSVAHRKFDARSTVSSYSNCRAGFQACKRAEMELTRLHL